MKIQFTYFQIAHRSTLKNGADKIVFDSKNTCFSSSIVYLRCQQVIWETLPAVLQDNVPDSSEEIL